MATPVKIKAIVIDATQHTDSIASYRLKPQGRVPKFRAGQYLHIALDEYHPDEPWPESRVFSIASSPSERTHELSVTISVKGPFTERIFKTLNKGSECWLKLPYGEFIFPLGRHLILIAGGIGITPYLSFLRQMLEEESKQSVTLFYGIRSIGNYLFNDLLDRCVAELTGFRKTVYCEDGSVAGEKGILDVNRIYASAPYKSIFYLSGPPLMIDVFRRRLLDLGVETDRIRVDNWE